MFEWLKRAQPQSKIRDTLFGDMSLDDWAGSESDAGEPWESFKKAKEALQRDEQQVCIQVLRDISNRKGLEPRHYLQSWFFLKKFGVTPPPEKAKELLGVVVEVGMDRGLDIVAAYSDVSARYYNYSGAVVVWERPDASLDEPINSLLNSAQVVVAKIGAWTDARPPEPSKGYIRINMLTPSGLHFGQGPFDVFASDPIGGPVVSAAGGLMQRLINKTKS
jgi:hypothetical protein